MKTRPLALGAPHLVRDFSAAVTIGARHLVRGSQHVASIPQPWLRSPEYRAGIESLRVGDLTTAREHAANAGLVGHWLTQLVDGELGLLTRPVVDLRPSSPRLSPTTSVVHLVTNALPEVVAGYTIRTQGIAAAQRRSGRDAHVVTRLGFPLLKGRLGAPADVTVDEVPHHRLLSRRLPFRADRSLDEDIERTARVVQRVRPAVLHAHSNHVNARVGVAVSRRFGIPLVYEVRGLLEETWLSRSNDRDADREWYQLTRQAEIAVMRAADAVVTLSESMRQQVLDRGVPAERIHVVPNCVDASWLAEPPLRAASRPLTLGWVGTLNKYEGVEVLLEAAALLRKDDVAVEVVVVGDGPEREALGKRAAELGITDGTAFTGAVPHAEVRSLYHTLDVVCLPRLDLPVTRVVPPLKPIEAMASGLPVVASDLPPLRELLGEGRGLLVPAGDPNALAAALEGLQGARDRHLLGETARDWVRRTRTWERAASTYEQIYGTLEGART